MSISYCLRFRRSTPRHGRSPSSLACLPLVLAACVLAAGCGRSTGGFTLAPVSGKVIKDGKGVQGVKVVFSPTTGGKGQAGFGSAAVTDTDGKFTLKTVESPPRNGAVVGKHFVTMTSGAERAAEDDSIGPAKGQVEIPAEYSEGSKSFDVPAGGTDKADFELKGPPTGAPAKGKSAASKWDS